VIVFDKDFKADLSKSLKVAITGEGKYKPGSNHYGTHEQVALPGAIAIAEPGYVFVYVSNETPQSEVYFDDFQIAHTTTPIVQKDDYYPFGGTFNSYVSGDPNDYKFQGMELQDETETYLTEFRTYDPWLGRWGQIDPKANPFESPYVGMGNNPLKYIDPLGDTVIVISAPESVAGAGHAAVLVGNDNDGYTLYSKNGTASSESSVEGGVTSSSGEGDNDQKGVYVGSLEDFANSDLNKDEDGNAYYTQGYMLPSDSETDKKAVEGANSQLDKDYNVLSNNCVDVCSDALSNAGFDPGYSIGTSSYISPGGIATTKTTKTLSPIPNVRYQKIKENNKGTDVSDRLRVNNR
jgi:RHS repeat-associated protein